MYEQSTHYYLLLQSLRHLADHAPVEEQVAAFQRLVTGLENLQRVDVYYRESGCDCCSGDYVRDPDRHGEYVEADDLTEVLRDAARQDPTEGV